MRLTKQHPEIIWEYEHGAWASLQARYGQPLATLLRVTRGISLGPATGELLRFDFQLTRVRSDWRVSEVSYGVTDGTAGPHRGLPDGACWRLRELSPGLEARP